MTVLDDNYTGHVEPGTATRRTLPGATIVKTSVGPMDNNAYLVTCSATGETLLIDAANDADALVELVRTHAPNVTLIVTSHQHFDHWQALEAVAGATGAPTAAHEVDAEPLPVTPDRLLAGGDTSAAIGFASGLGSAVPAAAAVAVGTILIMTVPALSTSTPGTARARRGRQAAVSGVTKAGADLALIALAVVAGWELRHYSAVSPGASGNYSVDPVFVIAPALALAGGTVLALRLLPAGG